MDKKDLLINIFKKWTDEEVINFVQLPQSGSYREYYRIFGKTKTAIGVFNADRQENIAFLEFTKHFLKYGLPVPNILVEDLDNSVYLLNDLGDETLFSYLIKFRKPETFPTEILEVYKKVLDFLPKFQIEAGKTLDYRNCYPRDCFDKQSMMWDLNYFKYYFLKLGKISFDEQKLESDFHTFTDYLLTTDINYFLYRDFQSRNIMLKDGNPYFIDYQGGRRGALQYDLASLIYDAKADLPQHIRTELLHYYISNLEAYLKFDKTEFIQMFFGYVLIRILQAMGAYGFRGFYEKKEHFLKSIPYAIDNLNWLLNTVAFPIKIPALMDVLKKIIDSKELKKIGDVFRADYKLNISIYSFSYKKTIPQDDSGNGGGFVFDCRAIHNPGRYLQYKTLNGKDEEVKKFLREESDMDKFVKDIFSLLQQTIDVYLKRKFTHLMVSFGCTGGQHRSVYAAEQLGKLLADDPNLKITIHHTELEKLNF